MRLIKNNKGVVPILTVVFVAVLLSIVSIAFIRLAINEQRQATNDDLTTAAFYAAESGLEDAKRSLQAFLDGDITEAQLNGADCNAAVTGKLSTQLSGPLDSAYTCQLIDTTPDHLVSRPGVNRSQLFVLDTVGNSAISRVKVLWHIEGSENDGADFAVRAVSDNTNPSVADWNNGSGDSFPAMLRVQMFGHPDNAIRTSSLDQQSRAAFLNPTNASSSNTNYNAANFDSEIIAASCDNNASDGEYMCQADINLAGGGSSLANASWLPYINVESLYVGDTVRIEAYNSANQRLSFQNGQAVLDITGRSGTAFRRVATTISLSDDDSLHVPDYVIVGGDRVCKNFYASLDAANTPDGSGQYQLNSGISPAEQDSCNEP